MNPAIERVAQARCCVGPYPCGRGAGANGRDLPCDCEFQADASVIVARAVIDHLLVHHPLPWRIEHDWTYEVTTSSGYIVAKLRDEDEAEQIIAFVESIGAERASALDDQQGTSRG